MLLLLVASFILFVALGIPIAYAMGLSALLVLVIEGQIPTVMLSQRITAGFDMTVLFAIPFFIMAGAIMSDGGLTRRLIDFANALVGPVRGGIAHVTVGSNMLMAGVSGSAVADASAISSLLIPTLIAHGYTAGFAAAISAAAATIGGVIPPSIPFVIVGANANVSIGALFLGGAVPGLLMGLYLMIVAYIRARQLDIQVGKTYSALEIARTTRRSLVALGMPVLILGGIFSGAVTTTEAAVLAVLYATVFSLLLRETNLKALAKVVSESTLASARILLVAACALAWSWVLAKENLGGTLHEMLGPIADNPILMLLFICLFLQFIGLFIESLPALLIFTPPLAQLAIGAGIDPVHFGVVLVINLLLGMLTPPVGMLMYVTTGIARCSVGEYVRELIPFYIALTLLVLTVVIFPEVVLFLPRVVMGYGG